MYFSITSIQCIVTIIQQVKSAVDCLKSSLMTTSLAIHSGLRVVRGSGWNYDDQDGGEGCVGTVVVLERLVNDVIPPGMVFVSWDNGNIANYSNGETTGIFDLRVFDNAQKGRALLK